MIYSLNYKFKSADPIEPINLEIHRCVVIEADFDVSSKTYGYWRNLLKTIVIMPNAEFVGVFELNPIKITEEPAK